MDRLSEIKAPTLVLAGRYDFLFPPEHQAILADRLPNAQLEIIERAGHNPQMERLCSRLSGQSETSWRYEMESINQVLNTQYKQESHSMLEIISNADAHYAFDIVKTICTEVGPGLPGSFQERERAMIIKKELESHLGAGNVVVEEFTVAPGAFLSLYPAFFMLIAALLNISMGRFTGVSPWLTAIAALAFSIISPLLFIFEFILGYELIDPFFKKKQSVNVIGTLRAPGTKNVKRLLISEWPP